MDEREQHDHQAGPEDKHVAGHVRGRSGARFGGRHMLLLVGHYALVTNGTSSESLGANAPRKAVFLRAEN